MAYAEIKPHEDKFSGVKFTVSRTKDSVHRGKNGYNREHNFKIVKLIPVLFFPRVAIFLLSNTGSILMMYWILGNSPGMGPNWFGEQWILTEEIHFLFLRSVIGIIIASAANPAYFIAEQDPAFYLLFRTGIRRSEANKENEEPSNHQKPTDLSPMLDDVK